MKSLIAVVFLFIISFQSAKCQNLTGNWSGEVTQENSQFKIGTIEISLNQVGGFLSGQIKTNIPQGFVIQKFRGMISDHKVVMTEYEVIKKSEDNLSWCLKILAGYLFTDNDTGKLILRGKWTSHMVHQSGNDIEFDCPPGTFSVTQSSNKSAPQKLASLTTSNVSRNVSEPKAPVPIEDIAKVVDIQKSDNSGIFPKPRLDEKVILAIQFEQSKAIILPSSQPELDRILNYLVQFPTLEIELSGHTDNRGDAIKNYKLSEERVMVVKKYLTDNGITSRRITGKGYGSKIPVAQNDSEENRKLNRRVEMKVTKE